MPGINIFNQPYMTIGLQLRKTVAKRDVYFQRHGVQYKRRYIIPPDPHTPAQLQCRAIFRQAVRGWQALTQQQKQSYNTIARSRYMRTGYNFYVSTYISTY